jgi:hypothetical protein
MRSLLAHESPLFGGPLPDDSGEAIAIDAASMADAVAVRDGCADRTRSSRRPQTRRTATRTPSRTAAGG